jgi:hypothetical protein
MLIREAKSMCVVVLSNGLTLEVNYDDAGCYGVWLLGDRLLRWVLAPAA